MVALLICANKGKYTEDQSPIIHHGAAGFHRPYILDG
jgi:hypothetical protein